jgi:nucleotide-binding universal stress UspA family protein
MSTQKLLLPYDFSKSGRKALEFTVNTFGMRKDLVVTLFHSYRMLPALEVDDKQVTDRLRGGMAYLSSKISELETEFESVKAELIQGGFQPDQIRARFSPRKKDVADEIIELHNLEHFTYIVLGRRRGKISRFFPGSVHIKLLSSLENVSLCIVT